MSENPYAPPGSDLGGASSAGFQPGRGDFEIGQCVSEAWSKTWSNFPLWLVVGLVYVVLTVGSTLTVLGLFLLVPVFTWGGTLFVLHMYDGGAEFGDLFAGFSDYGNALVGILVCMVVLVAVGVAGQSLQLVGDLRQITWLSLVGGFINVGVTFLISPRLTLSYFYVVDRGMPPVAALQQAWNDTRPVIFKLAVLVLLGSAIVLGGALLLLVGIIPASVMATLMFASAYRQLVGRAA